jgi:hypothetical protein
MVTSSDLGEQSSVAHGTLLPAAMASTGAGLIHAAAVGIHTEHLGLTRLFILMAVAQIGAAVFGLIRPSSRVAAGTIVAVNLAALAGWLVSRFTAISWIAGLEQAESPQAADTIAALLALFAVAGAAGILARRSGVLAHVPVVGVALLVGVLTVPAMVSATTHQHDHDGDVAHGDDHANDDTATAAGVAAGTDHHDDTTAISDGAAAVDDHHADDGTATDHHGDDATHAADWPRPWDPEQPFDFSGVEGVTMAQQARAERLVVDTLATLPNFADVNVARAYGYRSIGDAGTGFEHYINRSLIGDDKMLDPSSPESLVYRVEGDQRILVSAMFMVGGRAMDDPELTGFAGPLMEWHVHDNLCWGRNAAGDLVVRAVTDNHGGVCPAGTVLGGGDNPMVHVWITPHPCGPFAALEGHGAGQAFAVDDSRADQCHHDHGAGHGGATP